MAIDPQVASAAVQGGSSLLGGLLGLASSKYNDKRQLRQANKLQQLEIQGEKELSEWNKQQQYDLWEMTNYPAQVRMMEEAGLNVGLMYGKGGGGGTTANLATANLGGQNAPVGGNEIGMGMQMGLQAQRMMAEIGLIKEQTNKTKAETAKTAGVDTALATATTENLKAITANTQLQSNVIRWEGELQRIRANVMSQNEQDIIDQLRISNQKLNAEAKQQMNAGKISDATYQEVIKQAYQLTLMNGIEMSLDKANITNLDMKNAEIRKSIEQMANNIAQMNLAGARAEGSQALDQMRLELQQQTWFEQLSENDKERVNRIINTVVSKIK